MMCRKNISLHIPGSPVHTNLQVKGHLWHEKGLSLVCVLMWHCSSYFLDSTLSQMLKISKNVI